MPRRSRILILEDEPSIADNITYALETEGFVTEWHTTAREGLEAFDHGGFDLIVLDIGLP